MSDITRPEMVVRRAIVDYVVCLSGGGTVTVPEVHKMVSYTFDRVVRECSSRDGIVDDDDDDVLEKLTHSLS